MNKEEIKIEKRKPTWNYILNDLALYSLMIKVIHSEDATYQEKFDFMHQIKLLQNQVEKLTQENNDLEERINVLNHENIRLKEQLHQSSLDIQELTERDIFCPSSCEKLDEYKNVIDKAIKCVNEFIEFELASDKISNIQLAIYNTELLEILRSKDE